MATFQLFLQSSQAKDLSASLMNEVHAIHSLESQTRFTSHKHFIRCTSKLGKLSGQMGTNKGQLSDKIMRVSGAEETNTALYNVLS